MSKDLLQDMAALVDFGGALPQRRTRPPQVHKGDTVRAAWNNVGNYMRRAVSSEAATTTRREQR